VAELAIIEKGSGWDLEWQPENILMKVTRIKDGRDDGVKAEVVVFYQGESITRSSPTLTSESGKDSLTRKLNRRKPSKDYQIDWEACVEEMAGIIVDKHREGAKAVKVKDIPETEKSRWRVEPMILENINLIYGDGGNGKSITACFLATIIQTGYMSSDHGPLIVEPGNVLYLDWETAVDGGQEIKKRLHAVQKGLGLEPESNVIYRPCWRPFLEDVDFFIDTIAEHNIDVVIIDSMGRSVGGDIEKAADTNGYFNTLAKLKRPVVLLSHKNKAGDIFGSQYTFNNSRMIWEVQRSESYNEDGIDMVMFHRKGNDVAQQQPMAWDIRFEDDGELVTFRRKDVMDTDLSGELSIHDLVYKLILRDGSTDRDLLYDRIATLKRVAVDKIKGAVETAISRHVKNQKLFRNGQTIEKMKDDFSAEEDPEVVENDGEQTWTKV